MLDFIYLACVTTFVGIVIYLGNHWYRREGIPNFTSKYVFITGTDSGFGHKLAVDLDSIGVHVFAGCYTKHGAEKLKNETSDRLKTVSLDVTDQSSVEQAKLFIENNLPAGKQLWGLVNNAGIGGNFNFGLSTLEDYRETMEVNYFGSIRTVQVFEELIKSSKGRIVQVISVFGRGSVTAPAYTCSKFAIEPYTDELRRHMRNYGVKVCTIEPGSFTQTSIFDSTVWESIMSKKFYALPSWKKEELGKDYVENGQMLNENFKYEFTNRLIFIEIAKINGFLMIYPISKFNTLSMVTEAIIHGLGAKHPKTRYLVGYDARPFVLMTACAPDWLLDAGLRFILWLSSIQIKLWR